MGLLEVIKMTWLPERCKGRRYERAQNCSLERLAMGMGSMSKMVDVKRQTGAVAKGYQKEIGETPVDQCMILMSMKVASDAAQFQSLS